MPKYYPLPRIEPTDKIFIKRPNDSKLYYAPSYIFNRDVLGDLRLEPVVVLQEQDEDVITVSIQLNTLYEEVAIETAKAFYAYLASDEAGETLVATAPSGGWTKGDAGTLINLVANKAGIFITDDDGFIEFDIEEAETKTFYLVMIMPDGIVSGPLPIIFDAGESS
jgi:hypothetical protein